MRFILKFIILLAYAVLLAPWGLYFVTGIRAFIALGIVYALIAACLLPLAIRNWKY